MISEFLLERPKPENLNLLLRLRHDLIDMLEQIPDTLVCNSEITPEDDEDFAAVFLYVTIENRKVQICVSLPKPYH